MSENERSSQEKPEAYHAGHVPLQPESASNSATQESNEANLDKVSQTFRPGTGHLDAPEIYKDAMKEAFKFAEVLVTKLGRPGDTYVTKFDGPTTKQVEIGRQGAITQETDPSPISSQQMEDVAFPTFEELIKKADQWDGIPKSKQKLSIENPWENVEVAYEWFKNHLEHEEEQVFVVTLALLGGISQSDIFRVFQKIKEIFPLEPPHRTVKPRLFDSNVDSLMKAAHATFMETFEFNFGGSTPVTGIDFSDSSATFTILQMICRYYLDRLDGILQLLKNIAEGHERGFASAEVRRRACTAIGMFGQIELVLINRPILDLWSRYPYEEIRYAVSNVLAEIYRPGGRYTNNVLNIINYWAGMRNNLQFLQTAAVCCGRLGGQDLEHVLPIIRRLIKHDLLVLLNTLIGTVGYIFQGLEQDEVVNFLEVFADWTQNKKDAVLRVGSLLIVIGWIRGTLQQPFSRKLLRELEREKDVEFWNLPEKYSGQNVENFQRRYRRALYNIFAAALEEGHLLSQEVKSILFDFVRMAQNKELYRALVESLFLDLCCNDKHSVVIQKRVWEWLDAWSKAPKYRDITYLQDLIIFVNKYYRYS